MSIKKLLVGVFEVLLIGTAAYAVSENMNKEYSWRYRITVEVETPEGIKTGSAVREIIAGLQPQITPETKQGAKVFGEAVVVDLGKRGVLFALVEWDSYNEVFQAFPYDGEPFTREGLKFYSNLKSKKKAELNPYRYPGCPRLVTFKDTRDPKTIQEVMKWKRESVNTYTIYKDRFSELFGEGVNLNNITIEITDNPVTTGINKWLPWLDDYYTKRLDGMKIISNKSDYPLANDFNSEFFSRK